VLEDDEVGLALVVVEVRSVVEEEVRRSVAEARRAPPWLDEVDWICEEAYMLFGVALSAYFSNCCWYLGKHDRSADRSGSVDAVLPLYGEW